MKETQKELERLRFQYINKMVEIRAQDDFNYSFNIIGKKIGPFLKGNTYKMEFWIASIFVKNNIAKFDEKHSFDVKKIQKIAYTESKSISINPINPETFIAIKEHLKILQFLHKKGKITYREFINFYSNAQDLVKVRHQKIIKLATANKSMNNTANLTKEEKLLVDEISGEIDGWRDFFVNMKKMDL